MRSNSWSLSWRTRIGGSVISWMRSYSIRPQSTSRRLLNSLVEEEDKYHLKDKFKFMIIQIRKMLCKPTTKIKKISLIGRSLLRKYLVTWLVEAPHETIGKTHWLISTSIVSFKGLKWAIRNHHSCKLTLTLSWIQMTISTLMMCSLRIAPRWGTNHTLQREISCLR